MKSVTFILVLTAALAGCATKLPPTCDGADRRPVNQPAKTTAAAFYPSCGAGKAV